MERRDSMEAEMRRNWFNRNADPFGTPEPTERKPAPKTFETAGVSHQPFVDFNHAVDQAHAMGDPKALLDVQLRAMGMESLPPADTQRVVFNTKTKRA